MFKKLNFYPILFSIFPILSLAAFNVSEISLDVIVRPLLVSLLFGIALYAILWKILGDGSRSALASLTIIVPFFFYGQVYNLFNDVTFKNISIVRHRTLLPLFGLLTIALFYLVVRKVRRPESFTLGLNLISIWLLVYPTYGIISFTVQQKLADRAQQVLTQSTVVDRNKPDVYYIILDAYGREDVLKNMFGYDNQEFLNALRQRGFYIAECSQSNYGYTNFSLTSSLNSEYLDTLNVLHSRVERTALLKHSAIRKFLEEKGYKSVAFPTGWAFTEWHDADIYLDFDRPVSTLNEFETLVLNTTIFRVVYDSKIIDTSDASHKDMRRLRVLSLLDKIKQLPGMDANLFVFAHLVVPHRPYTFGPNGEIPAYDGKTTTYEETGRAYIDQVKFINNEILKVVDALLENSKVLPVIIIQGDHGPSSDLTNNASERMPILNAYYLPGVQMDKLLYPSISPVNSFRVVLNAYFNQNMPLLPDQSFYASEENRTDVTLTPNSCP